jgi:thioredoxin 1
LAIEIKPAEEATFEAEVLKSAEPVVVDFWAHWCGPCHVLAPELESLAQGEKGFRIRKVDVDRNPALAERHHVQVIPTLVLFLNGKELSRLTGVHAAEDLKTWIRNQLARAGGP